MLKPHHLFRSAVILLALLLCSVSLLAQADKKAAPAYVSLGSGHLDEAISQARAAIASNINPPFHHNVLCRAYYAENLADSAITECEAALGAESANSEYALWLGRAYGMKAEQTTLTAFSWAKRARTMFAHAVELDGNNADAINDLAQFYVDAPGIVGGSLDKADALVPKMQPLSPARAHRLLGLIADKRGDYGTAEREFSAAIAADHTPATLVDLALFYHRRARIVDAVAQLKQAVVLDKRDDAAIVDAASILADMHREPQLSIDLYRRYLASPAKSETASVPNVHLRLGRLLQKSGDIAGARREYLAALSLASGYKQARSALEKLPGQ